MVVFHNWQASLATSLDFVYVLSQLGARHDVPFYLPQYVALQKSFLDAWLQDKDDKGWLKGPNAVGGVPAVSLPLRSGNYGYNSPDSDIWFARRTEHEWPIPRTKYTRFYLGTDYSLSPEKPSATGRLNYDGFKGQPLHFKSSPSKEPMEITGHIIANLVVSVEADDTGKVPKDLDLFITLRHFDADDKEILYTGP